MVLSAQDQKELYDDLIAFIEQAKLDQVQRETLQWIVDRHYGKDVQAK